MRPELLLEMLQVNKVDVVVDDYVNCAKPAVNKAIDRVAWRKRQSVLPRPRTYRAAAKREGPTAYHHKATYT